MKNCLDCNKKLVGWTAKRCGSCASKKRFENKEEHPRFKRGLTLVQRLCIDCKKELSRTSRYMQAERCGSCSQKERYKHMRPNSWIDGRSLIKREYTKEFSSELKEKIRQRDNYNCQNCGMTDEEHIVVLGYHLTIHHIDYNKDNCNKENLITLCNQCNVRANKNREYWKEFYSEKV